MKVLHVRDHSLPISSGYSYRSQSIVQHQKRLGLGPVVLTSLKHGSRADAQERIDDVTQYRTGAPAAAPPFVRELLLMQRLAARITEVARQEQVSLIHAHSLLLNGLPALMVARSLGLPVVYEVRRFWEDAAVSHGTFAQNSLRYGVSRALETAVLRRVDHVVTICEGIRREAARRRIRPIGSQWCRTASIRPGSSVLRGPLASPTSSASAPARSLVTSGRSAPTKAYRSWSMPLGTSCGRSPGSQLLLVGSGRDESAVRTAVRSAGRAVLFPGRLPQEQVRGLYTLLDVLVLPRRRIRLTELVTPPKPLEAMASAKPILTSDVGEHAELITEGDTKLLFAAEDREALVVQAVRLGTEPQLRHRLGSRARVVAADRTWDQMVARYLPLYAAAC